MISKRIEVVCMMDNYNNCEYPIIIGDNYMVIEMPHKDNAYYLVDFPSGSQLVIPRKLFKTLQEFRNITIEQIINK